MSESRDVVDKAPAPPEQYRGRVANRPQAQGREQVQPSGPSCASPIRSVCDAVASAARTGSACSRASKPRSARGAVLAAVRASSGDRSWGQVWGFSGTFRAHRGRGAACNESRSVAGKSCKQARFLRLPPAARILHGKEGVDGSSPSEGFAKGQQVAFLLPGGSLAAMETCPQDLPPRSKLRTRIGLNRRFTRHRAPP